MLYNNEESLQSLSTAGKITIVTALAGVMVFMFAFLFDFGTHQLQQVSAQTATTSLTVLNTPPVFTLEAYEVTESSTSSPTNSGDTVSWSAIGTDSNSAPYFLLVCSTNASPTATAAADLGSLGTAPPVCGGGVQWGVSTSTISGELAIVSTTTTEIAPFAELNEWYAWVCDDDPTNPRCNNVPTQGLYSTSSSPFNVNSRPVFTDHANNGPVDPGDTLTFNSTSSDPDLVGGEDEIFLVVCNTNSDYNTTTNTCAGEFIASTTISLLSDAAATYTIASIFRDDTYPAYGYIVDEHGHEALTNPIQADFIVNNVAPSVLGGSIDLNGGADMVLTVDAGETTGFTLDFVVSDANSCVNAASGDEITGFNASVFRSDVGSSTCDSTAGSYDPNKCYGSQLATTTWNLNCNASSTSCTGPTDDTQLFECTFPLWFVADPTDAGINTPAALASTNWSAAVAGIDDNASTGILSTTSIPVELISFSAIDLITAEIPYGSLEPGDDSGLLNATTTVLSVGNTGIDQDVQGESMCGTYTTATECPVSASSTIPASEQEFSSTSIAYGNPLAVTLSSSTASEVELDVEKTTSTSTPNTGVTYWGIAVPATITLAGSYQGLNTFTVVTAEAEDWNYTP